MTRAIPDYLNSVYWWAYVHPRALRFWDRRIPMQSVLFGNYDKLSNAVLDRVEAGSKVVMLGSCYGTLIPRLQKSCPDLTIVDAVPGQLSLAASKCEYTPVLADAAASGLPSASADVVMMFFLLHELPRTVRSRVLAEAYRIAGPDGKVVICEFDRPAWWNPFGLVERLIFRLFEPFAHQMFGVRWERGAESHRFGGLYRIIESRMESAVEGADAFVASAAGEAMQALLKERHPRVAGATSAASAGTASSNV